MIVRSVVNAAHSSKPLSWRRQQLDSAIRHVRSLLDELETQRIALGWRDRESDVVAPRTFGELCAAPSETVKLTEGLDEP